MAMTQYHFRRRAADAAQRVSHYATRVAEALYRTAESCELFMSLGADEVSRRGAARLSDAVRQTNGLPIFC